MIKQNSQKLKLFNVLFLYLKEIKVGRMSYLSTHIWVALCGFVRPIYKLVAILPQKPKI